MVSALCDICPRLWDFLSHSSCNDLSWLIRENELACSKWISLPHLMTLHYIYWPFKSQLGQEENQHANGVDECGL